MTLIKFAEYPVQEWKNKLGTTRVIAEDKNNNWKLSAAIVNQAAPFSEYPNCQRLLCIWRGEGLLLNNFTLHPNSVYEFSGEEKILCKPLGLEVIDLGFIYQKNQYSAQMKFLNISQNTNISLNSDFNFLFCAKGRFKITDSLFENYLVNEGDTVKFENSVSGVKIEPQLNPCQIIHIELKKRHRDP